MRKNSIFRDNNRMARFNLLRFENTHKKKIMLSFGNFVCFLSLSLFRVCFMLRLRWFLHMRAWIWKLRFEAVSLFLYLKTELKSFGGAVISASLIIYPPKRGLWPLRLCFAPVSNTINTSQFEKICLLQRC